MPKILEQLEGKYITLLEKLDTENVKGVLQALTSIQNLITKSKLSAPEQENVVVWIDKILMSYHLRIQNQPDAKKVIEVLKDWQEKHLAPCEQLLPLCEAFSQIAAKTQGTPKEFKNLMGDQTLFCSNSDTHLQTVLTQFLQQNNPKSALRYGVALLQRQPTADSFAAFAQVALNFQDDAKAIASLQQAFSPNPNCAKAHALQGKMLVAQNNEAAILAYQRAIGSYAQEIGQALTDGKDGIFLAKEMFIAMYELMALPLNDEAKNFALKEAQALLKLSQTTNSSVLISLAHMQCGLIYGCKTHIYDATYHFSKVHIVIRLFIKTICKKCMRRLLQCLNCKQRFTIFPLKVYMMNCVNGLI